MWRRITRSELVKGSFFIFIANNISSFGNFIYNLLMARFLGPALYGDLGTIFSLLVLIATPLAILNLFLVKIISGLWGKNQGGPVIALFDYLTPRLFAVGLVVFTVLYSIKTPLASYLKITQVSVVGLVAFSFLFAVPASLNRALIQGTLKFGYMAINGIFETAIKVVVSAILFIFNFQLTGALLGPVISSVAAYLLSFLEIKLIFGKSAIAPALPPLNNTFSAIVPVFLATLTLSAFLSLDIILVHHFFLPEVAGQYVALSTVGKILYYAVGPIVSVMFPVISNRASRGTAYILPLAGTVIAALVLAVIMFIAFMFAGKFIITIIYGNSYLTIIPYLPLFTLFITVYSLNAILTYFLLSVSYFRSIYYLFPVSMLQGLLLLIFHASLTQVIWVNLAVSLIYLFLVSLFVIHKERVVIGKLIPRLLP